MADFMTEKDYEKEVKRINEDSELKPEQKARQLELALRTFENSKVNATREGVGVRLAAGSTRGKGSVVISWEEFPLDKPELLPKSLKEFIDITKVSQETLLVYALEGFNTIAQRTASDPIAEFINPTWDDETQTQFRISVRSTSKNTGMSIEEVANMLKPLVEKRFVSQAQ